ncbi:rho guanine nucleotide exchange factor 39 isoform X1 [Scyliorhinus canicula]|uniref:rho guanine nucleotide exchange factor 39 isoform X1 n=1 Tax=Scyliorhinus canicula TaxID=7830 RepID=UPI0018F282E4|nr:rho guanine nucleotide exchange factor 39 isoform X1 [Scyliorhinus canicula]XP_038667037.1 rho guanine nucleotide exchange factor 39 isoform X1 [Scyliorhinus canicula]XP_038667039.1 rho guanine nucleotide exchange factor 39 isoform X1 [Scyliorhinus canicula]XP_038667040.1 rho guanine nucleotide exchange factor 39 isoform X1 [Scyliorhinus canicula]
MSASSDRTPMKRHLTANIQLYTPKAREIQLTCSRGGATIEEQRARWERKRIRTAKELVETEQRYFEQLELVVVYFIEILKAKGTLQPDIRDDIFCTLKAIHSINRTLLSNLEDGKFGLAFDIFCPQLQLYTTYTDNMEHAVKVLQEQMRKNKRFARFKKLQESRPEFQGLTLEDLLPLPRKRVYQYKHLLRDLAENTSPDSPDFEQLTSAVKAVSEVSQHIQDQARRHENYLQMLRVQKLLKGQRSKVLAPGRKYIREGWLAIVPPKGEELKHKMFFLFSDFLLMAKPCHPLHPVHSDKFAWQKAYPLIEGTIEKVFGHTKSQGGLISLTFREETLLVMSNDQEDINDWYRCLSAAIGQLRSRSVFIQRKDNLARRPIRSINNSTAMEVYTIAPKSGGKRSLNTDQNQFKDLNAKSQPMNEGTRAKRIRLEPNATKRHPDAAGPGVEQKGTNCIIL